jgi:hypothetical protein
MERIVLTLCGLWVWMTRRRRIAAYIAAAKTLEFAHAHLLHDFSSRASTSDRGTLVPHQIEALALLEKHATGTYIAVEQLSNLGRCCRFVAEELRERTQAPALHPAAVPAAAPLRFPAVPTWARLARIRVRYRLPRLMDFPPIAKRLVGMESSGALWHTRPMESTESQAPLKAA